MAKIQNDSQKVQEKNQESKINKPDSLIPELQTDLSGSSVRLSHAIQSPGQASPESIQGLQEKFGNNVVRRVLHPGQIAEPIVDRSRTLEKQISDEIQRARGGGQPLNSEISSHASQKFGKNLDHVRLHTDEKSDQISRKIQAKAFTVGNDIFFRSGAYAPNSADGKRTIIHELTHVVQQSSSSPSNGQLKLGAVNDQYEKEADKVSSGISGGFFTNNVQNSRVVQRLSFKGIKSKVGGLFSRGGSQGTTAPTNTNQQQGVNPQNPPPVPDNPSGTTPDEWTKIQEAGITSKTEWQAIELNKQNLIKGLIQTDFSVAKELVDSVKNNNWPKDGNDNDIIDQTDIDLILKTLKITFTQWSAITEKERRDYLLKNSGKPYINDLKRVALLNLWPLDGTGNQIINDGEFTKITDTMGIPLGIWVSLKKANQRDFLLKASGTLSKEILNELALQGRGGLWPKDGNDNDLDSHTKWASIKSAFPKMSPSYWNGFDKASRGSALGKTDTAGVKEVLNQANYTKNSKEGAMEKLGNVTGHGVTDATLGVLGLSGSITSLSKGTGTNETTDQAGATIGAVSSAGSFLASTGSLFGGISQLRRGKRMAGENNSKASQALGKKQMSKGRWGITNSVFGMGGSAMGFGGSVAKAKDPTSGSDTTTNSFGVAGGLFGMFGSALGIGKGSASINSSRKRSSAAKNFIKKAPTGGTLSQDDLDLNEIARFTSKNQNKTGKGFGMFKSVSSFIGSALGTTGAIGGLSGMSSGAGLGVGIAGAAFSGLGILGGIGQMIAEKADKPKDTDVEDQVNNLIRLLQYGKDNQNPQNQTKGKPAAEFVKNVLKINLVDPDNPDTWTSWIDEDIEAAKALIKSKLSKL